MPIGRPFRRTTKKDSRSDLLPELLRAELMDTAHRLKAFTQEIRDEMDREDPPTDPHSSATGD